MPRGSPLVDITDQRFGSLTVINREPGRRKHSTVWMCLCDCGNYKRATRRALQARDILSCGTWLHERRPSPPGFLWQVHELWCSGKGRKSIAEAMDVTRDTVNGLIWRNPHLFPPREPVRDAAL